MKILEKIQKLPLGIRKIILWLVLIIVGIFLVWIWLKIFTKDFKNFQKEGLMEKLKTPSLKEKIEKDVSKIEIPGIPKF